MNALIVWAAKESAVLFFLGQFMHFVKMRQGIKMYRKIMIAASLEKQAELPRRTH